jgi:trehalose 6-phosphate phosphatase
VSDFDGTLSDIAPLPEDAKPRPEAIRLLSILARKLLKVCILSSRSGEDLRRLIRAPDVELLGDYGMTAPARSDLEAIRRFNARAASLLTGQPRVRLEEKPASTSVHFRADPDARAELGEALTALAEELGLRTAWGRLVLEVKPAEADKARALSRLLREDRPGAVAYIGDDENDRPVFSLLARQPLPHFAVGAASTEAAPDLFADCDLVVDGPSGVEEFLSLLADWAERARPRPDPSAADRSSR